MIAGEDMLLQNSKYTNQPFATQPGIMHYLLFGDHLHSVTLILHQVCPGFCMIFDRRDMFDKKHETSNQILMCPTTPSLVNQALTCWHIPWSRWLLYPSANLWILEKDLSDRVYDIWNNNLQMPKTSYTFIKGSLNYVYEY